MASILKKYRYDLLLASEYLTVIKLKFVTDHSSNN